MTELLLYRYTKEQDDCDHHDHWDHFLSDECFGHFA